jgi:hypothetical protein
MAMAIANLTLRFVLELAGFAAFGYAGAVLSGNPLAGVVAFAAAVVVWALVAAPKARNPLSQAQRDVVGTGILLLAALGVIAAGQAVAGLVLGVAIVANAAILIALGPDARDAFAAPTGRAH